MDTFSHAAWGYASLRWRGSRAAWWAALAGAAPDLFFFVPYAIDQIAAGGLGSLVFTGDPEMWKTGGPPLPPILAAAYLRYYVWTHSLLLVAVAAGAALAFGRRRLAWFAVPYALHLLMDIPTHERFAVQPFFPLSDWRFIGLSWGDPRIFWPQLAAVVAAVVWAERRGRPRRSGQRSD